MSGHLRTGNLDVSSLEDGIHRTLALLAELDVTGGDGEVARGGALCGEQIVDQLGQLQ
jgi:hypothetical protein